MAGGKKKSKKQTSALTVALVAVAQTAIDDVFGDTSVSQQETRNALKELRDDIDMKIGCIERDMQRSGGVR